MKKLLIATTAFAALATAASAQSGGVLNVLDWGGAYGQSHAVAYNAPFEAETGIRITVADADNPATPIKAMVEAKNVTIDVASVEYADAVRLCDEGLVEEIGVDALPPGADGTPAKDDFLKGMVTDCLVGTDVFATVYAFNTEKFADNPPVTGDPHIRFYAGAPLSAPGGHRIGTLCVIDTVPRTLGTVERSILDALRRLANETLAGQEDEE